MNRWVLANRQLAIANRQIDRAHWLPPGGTDFH